MDYEIIDQVIAWTLESNDYILHDGRVYRLESAEPSDAFPPEDGYIYFDVEDEWGDSVTIKVAENAIVPIVEIPSY